MPTPARPPGQVPPGAYSEVRYTHTRPRPPLGPRSHFWSDTTWLQRERHDIYLRDLGNWKAPQCASWNFPPAAATSLQNRSCAEGEDREPPHQAGGNGTL